jgi:DHA3 family macrolide efflux protein-like MFS transporter
MPTVSAVVPTMVPKEKLSRVNGVSFLTSGFIHTIGPLIAAMLLSILPIRLILWIDPITFIIALIPLIIIKIPKVSTRKKQVERSSFFTDLKEGFHTLKLIPVVSMMLLVSMFINFLMRPFQVLMPYFISFVHSGSPSDLALISAFLSGGTLLGALITSIKKKWKHEIFTYFLLETVIVIPTIVFILLPKGTFLLMAITCSCYGLLVPILNTIYLTLMQTQVPVDKMGRISSIDWAVSSAISPIGALLAGIIAEIVGVSNLIFYCAIIGMIISIIIWRFTSVRYNRDQEEETIENTS